ncbi:MAG: hypothetical protein A3C93_01445 [Candidatus Lloydbacteria bacterium RIFCSPHIGHO2_02_FULL_54_17]|uniref:Uncharacterized protein n=1 Tax=Candidatus Lloydbacteria bacterium RIFCSPHIGHO2_02_FULL_54_17 TaxID=1798664 RepID=A0A1G2DBJ3_9BACT|nr:MAG: hypothetical protein A2762_00370 [Candidatus Lloydbacteria bacterium RIFCSPHIGHO2_01_FULL_54_11]OGZ10995.1 MAG: hypothetical protein A3C93_01445 [Candidatus Lloydbacteria bacterium RIFCSPHIGHO2_02_FULL_54_17]OGZ13146.1 MAG: hypothetical protein A2948_02140 [Candidatus Lloydbacteria bacterium RIFCSPLOWO2_01_FULL_54_18]OGZ14857.1 MAG: hypothetical protein A3H76_06210 [Candidatus Lloydbacteria bacterium RIFCSPLOWO2_02_FULL_54_12]
MTQPLTQRDRQLTKRIMRRIYLIWSIRLLLHPTTLKALIAALLIVRSMEYVSYANVFANMPALYNVSAGMQFVKVAMYHTHPMTLVLLSSVAWLAVWAVADMLFRKKEAWL